MSPLEKLCTVCRTPISAEMATESEFPKFPVCVCCDYPLSIMVDAFNGPEVRSSIVTVQIYVNDVNEYEILTSDAARLGIAT